MSVDQRPDPGASTAVPAPVRSPGPRRVIALGLLAVAFAVLLAALLFGHGVTQQGAPGLPYAGAATSWGLPVSKLLFDVAAIGTVGALLLAVVLAPSRGSDLSATGLRAMRSAAAWAALWCLTSITTFVLALSDISGLPLGQVLEPAQLAQFGWSFEQGRAYLVVIALTALVTVAAPLVGSLGWGAAVLVAGVLALLPVTFTGHSASAGDHDLATSSLVLHVAAASLWVGGLLALVVLARRSATVLAAAVPRYSSLALWCFVATAASGAVNAWVRIGGLDAWSSRYGVLVIGKVVALLVLGALGWLHRRRTIPAIAVDDGTGTPGRAFLRLAAVEVLVMGAAVGLAVALSRTPTPVPATQADASVVRIELGYDLAPYSLKALFTQWRPDPLILTVLLTALALYLLGVRTLRRRGIAWPVTRTVSFVLGIAVAVFALTSGLAAYGPAMFSVHMLQHMVLMMVVPVLLGVAAPVTLALRALPTRPAGGGRGAREWLLVLLHSRASQFVTHPVVVLVIYIGSLYGFYFTPLFGYMQGSHLGHLIMLAHFVGVGCLYLWPILAIDPMPRKLPPGGRVLLLFATVPFHAFFGIALMEGDQLIGADFYHRLALPWVPSLLADQHLGGGIAWSFGEIPTLIVLAVVFVQWFRADEREAKRRDRRADVDGDAELNSYNDYLARLGSGRR